jgi:P4 family phage/plasmid primase-like protien
MNGTDATPAPYPGRDPDTLEEANALYQRFCDGEITLSESTIQACLRMQAMAIGHPDILTFKKFLQRAQETSRPLHLIRLRKQIKDPDVNEGDKLQLPDRSLDPKFHLSQDDAITAIEGGYNIGIYGTTDGFCFIDIDLEDGEFVIPIDKILDFIKSQDTFTVKTRSGGYQLYFITDGQTGNPHIRYQGEADAGECRRDWQYVVCPGCYVPRDYVSIKGRFKGYTDDATGYYEIINDAPIRQFDQQTFPEWLKFKKNAPTAPEIHTPINNLPSTTSGLSDDDIIKKASNAKNSDKFKALWEGSWAGLYPSQSEADAALCFILAFYTKDGTQIDRLFRRSKLYREDKWNRDDYRTNLIAQAITLVSDTYSGGVDYPAIAHEVIARHHIITWNKTIYLYHDGFHQRDEGWVDFEIQDILLKRNFHETKSITEAKRQIRSYIIDSSYSNEFPFNKYPNLFNIKNGILKIDLETGEAELIPHSPEYAFNYKATISYNKDAKTEPVEEYLKTLITNHGVLIQIPAHAILSALGNVFKFSYFLKGPADSGKSTYLNMLEERFFGTDVCSNISLQDMLFDRFRLPELEGKIANIYADLDDQKLRDIGKFKAITGGDWLTGERKHQNPFKFKNHALLVFSANKYPKIELNDPAFWSRWIPVKFSNAFDRDPTYEDKTFTPSFMEGFLNLVLTKIPGILEKGIVTNESIMDEWLSDSNNVHQYIKEELEKHTGALLIKGNVYQTYTSWCDEKDVEPLSKKALTEEMERCGAIGSVRRMINGKQEHCYQGFKRRGDEDPIMPDEEKGGSTQKEGSTQTSISSEEK